MPDHSFSQLPWGNPNPTNQNETAPGGNDASTARRVRLSDGGTFGCGRLRRAFSPVASGVGGHATGVLGLATAALCLAVCLGLRPSVGAPHRSSDLPLAQTFRNGSGYRPLLLHSVKYTDQTDNCIQPVFMFEPRYSAQCMHSKCQPCAFPF